MNAKYAKQQYDLIPLNKFNSVRYHIGIGNKHKLYPRPNGIKCNNCDSEMEDIDGKPLGYYPLQIKVKCPCCGYSSARIAVSL